MIVVLFCIAIFLIVVITLLLYRDNVGTKVHKDAKRLTSIPHFEDYPPKSNSKNVRAVSGLDYSDATDAEAYDYAFTDSKANGNNVLAETYRIVSLPCDGEGPDSTNDCYTLWTYDTTTGHIIKVGDNHYLPTEVHLDSRLIKSGGDYYVVEGDSVRLIYSE